VRHHANTLGCLALGAALSFSGCKRFERKHIPADNIEVSAYPVCDASAPSAPGTLFTRHLRSGPNHPDKTIVENYTFEDRGCVYAMRIRQDWPMGISDVEVLWDRDLKPVRIWKRMIIPGIPQAEERAELRLYQLQSEPVGIRRRAPDGNIDQEHLLGGRPLAVIGPGRGLISAWIRRAKLAVGEKRRELIIDVRALEKIEPVTLQREVDLHHPILGKVAVYTFYGRETVFVDAEGAVVGDLAGLVTDQLATNPPPPPLPQYGAPVPVHSP
jgi:hypothetical protein